jgi:hypothetical protein
MNRAARWIGGFARFWYHFIVGDDWMVAAAVALGLAATAVTRAQGFDPWWLLPLVVVTILGVSVRRARRA